MSKHSKALKAKINRNSKKMSDLYLVEALRSAAESDGQTLNGDLRLERMIEVLSVTARHNCTERIFEIQQKALALNQCRNLFSYKPNGFDQMVDEVGTHFFFAVVDSGLGWRQLSEIAYLIPFDLLKIYNLLDLRRSNESLVAESN